MLLLHIKLGKIVKGLGGGGSSFQYMESKFPKVSGAKIKKGVFVGSQIRQLVNYKDDQVLHVKEKVACHCFKSVIGFLGRQHSENFQGSRG